LAILLRDNLRPCVNVYVEWGNEVWGFGMPVAYNTQKAEELGIGLDQHFAKRTADIALIFGEVFGDGSLNDRVMAVLTWQFWDPASVINSMMRYLDKEYDDVPGSYNADGKYANPNEYIYAAAVAPYFSEPHVDQCTDVATVHRVMLESIEEKVNWINGGIKMASKFGLPGGLMTYEGGPHHNGGHGNDINLDIRTEAQKDPIMTELIKYYIVNNWFALGGGLFTYYSHVGGYSIWGYWGCLDDFSEDQFENAPKYKALREISEMPLEGYELIPTPEIGG